MSGSPRAPEGAAIEVVVRRWLDAVTRGPVETLRDLYLGDATASIARAEAVRSALEEIDGRIDELVIEAPRAAWRWTVSGRHVRALAGVAPTGRLVELHGVNFQRFQDGRVAEHWTAVDLAALSTGT
jgi:predicted ester cyclase